MTSTQSLQQLISLEGRTALITGAALGIGRAIATRLHEAGANVVVTDLKQETVDELAAQLNELREGSARSYAFDVSQTQGVAAAFQDAAEQFGAVDILVNNAGIYPFVPLSEMGEEDFMKVIEVNLKGTFLCTKAAAAQMKSAGKGGRIINITSIDALHPSMVGLAHYDSSKHGQWGFTKNIALELAADGILVNAIAPGAIATPGVGVVDGNVPDALQAFVERIPLGRMGEADEIANVAVFLASDLSSYMTGSQVVVDGGRLLP